MRARCNLVEMSARRRGICCRNPYPGLSLVAPCHTEAVDAGETCAARRLRGRRAADDERG